MPDIYVCGHGGWRIRNVNQTFFTVPAGTEIRLFKEVGDVLLVSEAEAILRRSPPVDAVRVVTAGYQCPDMSLFPATEFWRNFGRAASTTPGTYWHAVAKETRLSDMATRNAGSRIFWIACSVRGLRRT